ncbi:hypothetical protein ACF0H5_021428 [Mactra antiquata]
MKAEDLQGIGRCLCLYFAKLKAHVIGISRTQTDLDSLKAENDNIEVHQGDINDWDQIEKVLLDIGPVDYLVNNAGVFKSIPVLEVTKDLLDYVTDINYKGSFHVSQVVAKQMIEHKIKGSLVNISSIAGKRIPLNFSLYSCSKAALDTMTKCFARELAKHKIRVNSLNPTLVNVGMVKQPEIHERIEEIRRSIPMERLLEAEDVAKAVEYLLSDNAAMITGVNLSLDGGQELFFL